MIIDLKDYVCTVPFQALEIHENRNFMCCASWLTKELPRNVPLKELWNSKEAMEIRESVMDGSYRFCDKKQCPFLAQLLNYNMDLFGPIKRIQDLPEYIKDYVIDNKTYMENGPTILQMSFDRTCNYKCPSCRVDMIVANSSSIKRINTTIEEMENTFSDSIETIYCSGTADPFASVSYRNYFRNFNPERYPKLKNIHLHTNASLWNKEMWESMPNIHKFVLSCEISIDAGTKNTYENVTRLGGDWDNLISNLKFISTIKSLRKVKTSFVVQSTNYQEMGIFLNTMKDIFKMKSKVFFGKINNWGTFTPEQFELLKIWNTEHPEHNLFLKEFEKVHKDPFVFHNLHEFLVTKKSLI
jgi:hypothetical protein